jgi:hypothetical protein
MVKFPLVLINTNFVSCVKTALVVMMEETGVQTENQQQVTDKLYHMKLFKGNFTICRNQADKVSVSWFSVCTPVSSIITTSAVLMHGHAGQLPGGATSIWAPC